MGLIEALAVVIGIMGGIATGAALQINSAYFVIWVTFVAWASFYAAGGGNEGIAKSTAANVWGAVIAWGSLTIFSKLAGGGMNIPLAGALCVGIAIIVLIMGAKVPALGFIPGQVFGYAPTAGLFVAAGYTGGKLLIAAIVSLIIGNVLGIISEKAAGAVAKS
ncbi:MAG: DUF1097 domain-containing protein [Nocardioides sp.]